MPDLLPAPPITLVVIPDPALPDIEALPAGRSNDLF